MTDIIYYRMNRFVDFTPRNRTINLNGPVTYTGYDAYGNEKPQQARSYYIEWPVYADMHHISSSDVLTRTYYPSTQTDRNRGDGKGDGHGTCY